MCFLFLGLFMESCICMTKSMIFYFIKLFTSNTTNVFQFLLLFCLTITSSFTACWNGGRAKAFICGFFFSLLEGWCGVEVITARAPSCADPGTPLRLLRRSSLLSSPRCNLAARWLGFVPSRAFTAKPGVCLSTMDLEIRFVSD